MLLKVRAAGICHTDIHLIDGMVPLKMPVTLGHEIPGEVDEAGPGAESFHKGERFVVHFWSPCGSCRYCLEGRGMQCENLFARPVYGSFADGGYAEYCKVSADRLVPVPQDIPWEFAATLGCAGTTSLHAVNTVGKVKLGEEVGVYGAGGVGMYTIQIAKLSGARVTAVSRNGEKLRMAERLGADSVVNASDGSVSDEVRKASNGKGVDVMFDFVVNDESVKNSTNSLANGGRLVLAGLATKPLSIDPMTFGLRELSLAGTLMGTKNELATVVELARTNRLKSAATRRFSLEEVNEGIGSLRKGEIIGRGYVSF